MLRPEERQAPPALWGGVECTLNRVGASTFDQLALTGHARRIEDLDLFAGLGLRALRYPILWERVAPDGLDRADWTWADARLGRLRALEVEPIVGLLHHGSGPAHTSLMDAGFPEQFADYALAVARRYPWVKRYTPINEPLTTARFSGLYGHWHPHGRDGGTFARILLNQCRAVVLAMRAIRTVVPDAQLVQTEDIGTAYSTPALAYQADFENERRWLSLDLLCGRVDDSHPLYHHLRWLGVDDSALSFFRESPCPPDVLGIDYYVISERFLDERTERYPLEAVGGNGRHSYVDVEAVRVCAEGIAGLEPLLREAWRRYGCTLAVTEAHIACTAEEQIRWFGEVWEAARQLRREGVDVEAVTAWALLGAYDWDCLMTRRTGYYEPGVFALTADGPQPTLLAAMLRDLAARGAHPHPALDTPGWWHRPERLLYPPASRTNRVARATPDRPPAR